MVGFTSYKVENDKRLAYAIDFAVKEIGNLRFPLGEISRDIYKTTKQNFILKGSGKYTPLSEPYRTDKKKAVGDQPILVYSGSLRDSVTGSGNSDSIRFIGNQTLVQGTRVPYAKYIQEGTRFGSDSPLTGLKMPARKYLFIDDAQAFRIETIILDYVISKLEVIGDVK